MFLFIEWLSNHYNPQLNYHTDIPRCFYSHYQSASICSMYAVSETNNVKCTMQNEIDVTTAVTAGSARLRLPAVRRSLMSAPSNCRPRCNIFLIPAKMSADKYRKKRNYSVTAEVRQWLVLPALGS